jgi:hypothetical protein
VGSVAFVWVGAQVQRMLTRWCKKSNDIYLPDETIFRVSSTFYSNNCSISFQSETHWTEQHIIRKPAFQWLRMIVFFFASLCRLCSSCHGTEVGQSTNTNFYIQFLQPFFFIFFQIIDSFAWMPRIWLEFLKMSKYVINDHPTHMWSIPPFRWDFLTWTLVTQCDDG